MSDTDTRRTGFAGIGERVSQIINATNAEIKTASAQHTPVSQAKDNAPRGGMPYTANTSPYTGNQQSSLSTRKKLFWWATGIVGFLVILANIPDNSPGPSPASNYTPNSTAPVIREPRPPATSNPFTQLDNGYTPPVIKEERPPVGNGLVLSSSQIRYCLYEKVRLKEMEELIDSNELAGLYNANITDYNSRCGSFRYRTGSLEPIRSELAANAAKLRQQAYQRVRSWRNVVAPGR
jgi:hypothetical protein